MPAPSEAPPASEIRGYLTSLSNWGRWGSEDELGTVNLITPAKRRAAARLVTTGESVTCARPITTDITADTTVQPLRFMVDSGEGRDTVSPERALQRRGAAEFIGMVFHGYTITHVDAPSHYFWDGQLYNGRSCNAVTSREGATTSCWSAPATTAAAWRRAPCTRCRPATPRSTPRAAPGCASAEWP